MKVETFPLLGKYRLGWMIVFILAFVFIYGLVIGLTESIRELDQTWLILFGIIATATGWLLGGARHKTVLLFIIGIVLGFLGLIFIQSGVYQPLYRAYVETFQLQIHLRHPQFFRSETGPLLYFLYTSLGNLRSYWIETS